MSSSVRADAPTMTGGDLYLVCAYRGADRDGDLPHGAVAVALGIPQTIGHRRVHRDFYANPRDLRYQLAMVTRRVHARGVPARVLLDRRHAHAVGALPELAGRSTELVDFDGPELARRLAEASRDGTAICLVFADALGLGCEPIERVALGNAASEAIVLNGRRREFRLDSEMRHRLLLRRFLARTRIAEYGAALGLAAIGYLLAGYDRLRGRR